MNQRVLKNKLILYQSNPILTTHYFNFSDILYKFGGIFSSISAFFGGISALYVHKFVEMTAKLINRKQWYKAYKELIQIYKNIIRDNDDKLDPAEKSELAEILELSLETYDEGEECMRRLETIISNHKLLSDEVTSKQNEIIEIKNTDLYEFIGQLKLIFSLLNLYKMDRRLQRRKD